MRKIVLAASILAMTTGMAMAQQTPSTADKPAESGAAGEKMTPGTTGAMKNEAGSVATSPQDVQKQGGMGVGADGDKAGKSMGGGKDEKPK